MQANSMTKQKRRHHATSSSGDRPDLKDDYTSKTKHFHAFFTLGTGPCYGMQCQRQGRSQGPVQPFTPWPNLPENANACCIPTMAELPLLAQLTVGQSVASYGMLLGHDGATWPFGRAHSWRAQCGGTAHPGKYGTKCRQLVVQQGAVSTAPCDLTSLARTAFPDYLGYRGCVCHALVQPVRACSPQELALVSHQQTFQCIQVGPVACCALAPYSMAQALMGTVLRAGLRVLCAQRFRARGRPEGLHARTAGQGTRTRLRGPPFKTIPSCQVGAAVLLRTPLPTNEASAARSPPLSSSRPTRVRTHAGPIPDSPAVDSSLPRHRGRYP